MVINMVTGIQNGIAGMGYPPPVGSPRAKSADVQLDPLGASPGQAGAFPFKRERLETTRTGFGDGTVSVPTAAIRTLDKGLESARRIVPSVEDIQTELRTNAAQRRDEAAKVSEKQAQTTQLSNPVEQSRGIINAMDRTASLAQARLSGETPSTDEKRATIAINGQSFSYVQQQSTEETTNTTPKLNVLI